MLVILKMKRREMGYWWTLYRPYKEWSPDCTGRFYPTCFTVYRLITELGEGEMMSFTLTLNDDLTATLKRYKDLMKGKKPIPFLAGGKLPWVVDKNKKTPSPKKL